jgi:aryl-alcohol dehydrogenase-like predicted oxidoreductase
MKGHTNVEHRRLGRSDLTVSSISMGCVTLGRELDREGSFAVLDRAWERGITLFDTAEAYAAGGSETMLGAWLADRRARDQIVLATKVSAPLSAQRVRESAAASLRRLQTDRIDLFQLHGWDAQVPLEETLDALTALVRSGQVRHVGCSNVAAWQLAKMLIDSAQRGSVRMTSVQPPYNLVQREIEPELLPLCRDQEVAVLSYSPLGAGFLSGKYQRGGAVPRGTRFDVIPGHQPLYFTPTGYRVMEGLERLAAATGQPMVQLALAWVLRRPGVTSVLIGARTPEQVDQAFAAQQLKLPDDVLDQLDTL